MKTKLTIKGLTIEADTEFERNFLALMMGTKGNKLIPSFGMVGEEPTILIQFGTVITKQKKGKGSV